MEDVVKSRGFEGGRTSVDRLLDIVLRRMADSRDGITARREPGDRPRVLSLRPDDLVVGRDRPGVLRVSASNRLHAKSAAHLSYIRQPQTQQAGYAGASTYVAVIDTGVNYTYSDFGSCSQPGGSCRVAAYKKVVPGDNNLLDDSGHGSNVASIVTQVAPGPSTT
jgi:hypothetical protein